MADPTRLTIRPHGEGMSEVVIADSPAGGLIEREKYDGTWRWTVGLGWHNGLPTYGAALDALCADPAFLVDIHGEGRPSANDDSPASGGSDD